MRGRRGRSTTRKRSTLAQRSQREREWATQGLSRAKNDPDEKDKNIKAYKINQTEKLAGTGGAHGSGDGSAGGGRAAARVVGPADDDRHCTAQWRAGGEPRATPSCRSARFDLGPVTLEINYGERVVIVGPNGSGKTTLLGALLGEVPLTSGTQRLGPSVQLGTARAGAHAIGRGPATTTLAAFQAVDRSA